MVFTRMGEGFGGFMAEYVLGQIISREHYFSKMAEYQRQKVWSRYTGTSFISLLTVAVYIDNGTCYLKTIIFITLNPK